ncbi:MAG: histidine kinase [Bacteroidota bacterium]|nr:histidine kinase [Candidatus Kapabacteria bacterium]MDW8220032.1 histidine kinase [Bacteroidota bacterium]
MIYPTIMFPPQGMTTRQFILLWIVLMLYAGIQALFIAKETSIVFVWVLMHNLFVEHIRFASIYGIVHLSWRHKDSWRMAQHVTIYAAWVFATSLLLIGAELGIVMLWKQEMAFQNIWDSKHWIFLQHLLENLLIIVVSIVVQYRRELIEREERERTLHYLNTQMELATLRAQLNPHFLFNALNVINALIQANPDEARRVLQMVSDLLRYALQSNKRETVLLYEELSFVRKYLAIEHARFGKRLEYCIEADESLLHMPIPPMIIQPLVENAIKHGISPKTTGGKVYISVIPEPTGKGIVIQVVDNGVGIRNTPLQHPLAQQYLDSTGIGLANTAARLQKLFGSASALNIHGNNAEGGVTVQLLIPSKLHT